MSGVEFREDVFTTSWRSAAKRGFYWTYESKANPSPKATSLSCGVSAHLAGDAEVTIQCDNQFSTISLIFASDELVQVRSSPKHAMEVISRCGQRNIEPPVLRS